MTYYYTAITHNETNEIQYPEHFEAEAEMLKRSRQLEAEARRLGPWKCYKGTEPPEAFLARMSATLDEGETAEHFQTRVNALAEKAGAKTVSVLTGPEIDDREIIDHSNPGAPVVVQAGRPLPEWARAQHEAEKAGQVLSDITAAFEAAKARADAACDEVFGTSPERKDPRHALDMELSEYLKHEEMYYGRRVNFPPRPIARNREITRGLLLDVEQYAFKVATAQADHTAKMATAQNLMDAEQTASKARAKEDRKNA